MQITRSDHIIGMDGEITFDAVTLTLILLEGDVQIIPTEISFDIAAFDYDALVRNVFNPGCIECYLFRQSYDNNSLA